MSEISDAAIEAALRREMAVAVARQVVAAGNLANVDTPGYRAREIAAFDEVLDCDVLSLHVPLTSEGDHPTRYLLGAAQLQALATRALLINTARGAVVDNAAPLGLLRARADLGVCLFSTSSSPRDRSRSRLPYSA